MNTYQRTLLSLSLEASLPRAAAVNLYRQVMGLPVGRQAIDSFNDRVKNRVLCDGMIVEKVGDKFYLDSGDRRIPLTDEALKNFAPDWAARLHGVLRDWQSLRPE